MFLRISALLALCYLVTCQDDCTRVINQHHRCMENAMNTAPDHMAMKQTVDGCFTRSGCSDTPETYHRKQGGRGRGGRRGSHGPPPPREVMECIRGVVENVQGTCQRQLRIPFSFPKHSKNFRPPPPPPPPHGFGPPPGAGGQGGGFRPPPPHGPPGRGPPGPPDFSNIITATCPTQVQSTVKQCVDQAHDRTKPQHQQFHNQMRQCTQMLQSNQECFEELNDAKEQMCACSQLEARKQPHIGRIQECARQAPQSRIATSLNRGRLPRMIFGPICRPPPPPGGFGGPPPFGQQGGQPRRQPGRRGRWPPRAREEFNLGHVQAPPQQFQQ